MRGKGTLVPTPDTARDNLGVARRVDPSKSQPGQVRYSICMTSKSRSPETVGYAMESILGQLDRGFEVVVCDAGSSPEAVAKIKNLGEGSGLRFRLLIREGCNRGEGRQAAFEASSGPYVVSNMDVDDVYESNLKELLRWYHAACEGKVVRVVVDVRGRYEGAVTLSTRDALMKLGGWHDLRYFEDRDLWKRAGKEGLYRWVLFPIYRSFNVHDERRGRIAKFRYAVLRKGASIRIGRIHVIEQLRENPLRLPVLIVAWFSVLGKERYTSEVDYRRGLQAPEDRVEYSRQETVAN